MFNCILYNTLYNKLVNISSVQFSSVTQSCPDSLRPHRLQHTRLPCPSQTPGAYSNSHPSSRWCHPTISFCVVPFSSCLQSLPASGSFLVSQLFTSGGQSIFRKIVRPYQTDKVATVSILVEFRRVLFRSVNPMDWRMPGFPVHYQLPELTQTHVHWAGDAIQPFHPCPLPLLYKEIHARRPYWLPL